MKRCFEISILGKKKVERKLQGTHIALHENPTSPFLQNLESDLEMELIEILEQEEWLWYMKCRVDWLFEGKRNTTFFHKSVTNRRSTSRIYSIMKECGEVLDIMEQIRDHICLAFKTLYETDLSLSLSIHH